MNKYIAATSVAILAFGITVSGCGKGGDKTPVAKVNRTTITAADFKKQFDDLKPQMQQAVVMDPKARKDFLEDLIGIELVVQEAKKQGLDKDAEYKKSMEAHKKEIEDYKKKLDQKLQDVGRDELFSAMLKKDLGDKMNKVSAPTDKEARDYYNKNKDKIQAMFGKLIAFKDIEQQIKMRLMQEKQRELYMEYAKGLKAKASVSIDDKALDAALADASQPAQLPDGQKAQQAPEKK